MAMVDKPANPRRMAKPDPRCRVTVPAIRSASALPQSTPSSVGPSASAYVTPRPERNAMMPKVVVRFGMPTVAPASPIRPSSYATAKVVGARSMPHRERRMNPAATPVSIPRVIRSSA